MKIVALDKEELEVVKDHLQAVISLDSQIKQLKSQLARERRDLEVSFANAVRRDMIERGEAGDIPRFVGEDGMMNVRLDSDGVAWWVQGREPQGKE